MNDASTEDGRTLLVVDDDVTLPNAAGAGVP